MNNGGIEMDKKLEGILNILEALNFKTKIVNEMDFEEQYDNLQDFKELNKDLNIILNKFNTVNLIDVDEAEGLLFEIHRIITTCEWHFSEISDLNAKILKQYKDKINNV